MKLAILGIDLAKSVFHLHGADARGRVLLRKRLSRVQLLPFIGNLPRCVVAMEAFRAASSGRTTSVISPCPCANSRARSANCRLAMLPMRKPKALNELRTVPSSWRRSNSRAVSSKRKR
jgi:transposase